MDLKNTKVVDIHTGREYELKTTKSRHFYARQNILGYWKTWYRIDKKTYFEILHTSKEFEDLIIQYVEKHNSTNLTGLSYAFNGGENLIHAVVAIKRNELKYVVESQKYHAVHKYFESTKKQLIELINNDLQGKQNECTTRKGG